MKNLLLILLCGIGISMYAQSEPIVKQYKLLKEYQWESDSSFYPMASDEIGNSRVITISPDWSFMILEFNNPGDTIVIVTEIMRIYEIEIKGHSATAYSLLSTEGYPFYIEMTIDAVAFYFQYNPEGGYGGFHKSELLHEIIK